MVLVDKRGYWIGEEAKYQHVNDKSFSYELINFLIENNCNSIIDFGCGMGTYIKHFRENGIDADGIDGNPETEKLTEGRGKVYDLSKPIELKKSYDWVMSLEVGEHLPKQFESQFIENIHKNNNNGVILSWAIKGQGGYGHFNEQNNE
jgi:2-polyprenyl-3-methyl-5-hydroxy-6-metoxy-1,4-benzoquinol methylase